MNFKIHQALMGIFHPSLPLIYFLRKLPLSLFFEFRLEIDAVHRPYYGYCLLQAATEAKRIGVDRISAMEFGVAAGHGLIELEKLAEQVSRVTGVKIDVYGFDLEIGLPTPADYRDLPYIWQKDFYKMDKEALIKKIKPETKLVLGNVSETVPEFIKQEIAPIGFIAFDLDYYTSTADSFKLFDCDQTKLLPRVFCYFDDIVGTDEEILCEEVGELLAIREFNEKHSNQKICKINGLAHKRIIKAPWCDMIYVLHNLNHKDYNTYIYHQTDRQMKL